MLRAGLRTLVLQSFPEAEFGEAGTARETVQAVMERPWDIVLLDLDLPDRGGLDLLADLRQAAPKTPVLVVSGLAEKEFGLPVLKAGAAGFWSKTEPPDELATAIHRVLEHGKYVSARLAERLAGSVSGETPLHPHERLSARELQILISITAGRSVGEIAKQLSLSVKTVSTYRTRLLKKMGVSSNAELMRYGLRHGLTR